MNFNAVRGEDGRTWLLGVEGAWVAWCRLDRSEMTSEVGSADDDDEERERDEGSAREFAGRLKHGSAVGRPQTPKLASLPLRSTFPRPPSAPRTDKGWQGAQRA